jgi:hypothetical protein
LSQYGGVKEVQAHLRHSRATTTLEVYIQEIPDAVRQAVEELDAALTSSDEEQKPHQNS